MEITPALVKHSWTSRVMCTISTRAITLNRSISLGRMFIYTGRPSVHFTSSSRDKYFTERMEANRLEITMHTPGIARRRVVSRQS